MKAQKKEAEKGSDNIVIQPAEEDDFIRSTMRHDSSMRTVTVGNINSDLKVGAETTISKDNRPDSSEQTEDTSPDKKSDEADEESTVPGLSRHTGVKEDKTNKHYDVTRPDERICQENYPIEGTLGYSIRLQV